MREKSVDVLVVEDEEPVADLYAKWLAETHDVRTAYSGEEALDRADEDVDVVLLDRRMPGTSGDEVLEELLDRGLDPAVAMVTAVEPDVDVMELGFDGYVVKPVRRAELLDVVETLARRYEFDAVTREYFAVASKLAALERHSEEGALADEAVYERLERRRDELQAEVAEVSRDFATEDFQALFLAVDE